MLPQMKQHASSARRDKCQREMALVERVGGWLTFIVGGREDTCHCYKRGWILQAGFWKGSSVDSWRVVGINISSSVKRVTLHLLCLLKRLSLEEGRKCSEKISLIYIYIYFSLNIRLDGISHAHSCFCLSR